MKTLLSKPILYYFTVAVIYAILFVFAILNLVKPNFLLNIFFALFFILSSVFNYKFLKNSYNISRVYSKNKLILLSIIYFIVTDIICKIPDYYDVTNYALVILCSCAALPITQTIMCLSLLTEQKHPNVSKVLCYLSISVLFLANIVAIIRVFVPVR